MSLTAETALLLIEQSGMPEKEIDRLITLLRPKKKKKKNTGLLSDKEAKEMLTKFIHNERSKRRASN